MYSSIQSGPDFAIFGFLFVFMNFKISIIIRITTKSDDNIEVPVRE